MIQCEKTVGISRRYDASGRTCNFGKANEEPHPPHQNNAK